jgi:hypothetical protein
LFAAYLPLGSIGWTVSALPRSRKGVNIPGGL